MKKVTKLFWALLIPFIVVVSGCDLIGNNARTGTLSLNFDTQKQKAFFGPILEIANYTLDGVGPGGKSITETWVASSSHTISNLVSGTWSFSVTGIDSDSITIARADFDIEIRPGITTEKTLALGPVEDGQGTVSMSVDWSDLGTTLASPALSIEYEKVSNEETGSILATISGTTATATAPMDAGYYLLYVKLMDGTTEKYVWNPQALRIAAEKTTSVELKCDATVSPGGDADMEFDGESTKVEYIDFHDKSTVTVKLKNVSSGSMYLNKANNSSSSVAAGDTGNVLNVTTPLKSKEYSPNLKNAKASVTSGGALLFDKTEAQNFVPPPTRELLKKPGARTIRIGDRDTNLVAGTSMRNFWVESASGDWIQEPTRLMAIADIVYIWIPDKYFSNSSTKKNDNLVTQAQIDLLKDKFNGPTSYNGTEGIRALVSTIFSTENGGEPGGDGGIDHDQHIHILLYDIDYDYTSTQTGGTLGYFWAKDEYPDSQMQQWGMRSNEAEIFYLDVHFLDYGPMMMVSCLAHEYQHMINFNQKTLLRNVSSVPTWFNEMCSLVAEDFVGQSVGIPEEDTPRSRIRRFNSSYYDSGVVDWLEGSNVLKSYASAYVFGAFLARNFGGATLFHDMVCSSAVGTEAVTNSVVKLGTAGSFGGAFLDYATAFVFDDSQTPSIYAFPELNTIYNGIEYSLPAFSLYDYSPNPTAFGPQVQTPLRPYGNALYTSPTWTNLSDNSIITLQKPNNANVNFVLMYKQDQ